MDDNKIIKVLNAMDIYLPYVDGVVNVMHNTMLNYSKNIKTFAFAPKTKGQQDDKLPYDVIRYNAIPIPFTAGASCGFPSLDRKSINRIIDEDFDIIHCHSCFEVMKVLTKIAKIKKIPIVATYHTNYRFIFERVFKLKFLSEPYIQSLGKRYSLMQKVFVSSPTLNTQLKSIGFKGETVYIPFGNNFKKITKEERDKIKKQEKAKLHINDEIVFCYVGRLVESKRVQFSLEALNILKNKGYAFKFVITGIGNYESTLKHLVKKYNLEDNVIFTGFKEKDELKNVYCLADVFLFPSLMDTFGLVKTEAATFFVPSVMVKTSDAAYSTDDCYNSFLFDDNLESYVNKLLYIINNKDKIETVGNNAYSTLPRSWGDYDRDIENEYRKIIQLYNEGCDK